MCTSDRIALLNNYAVLYTIESLYIPVIILYYLCALESLMAACVALLRWRHRVDLGVGAVESLRYTREHEAV